MNLIQRLISFWKSCDRSHETRSALWNGLIEVGHKPLIDALESGDESLVKAALDSFATSGCAVGIGGPTSIAWDSEKCIRTMELLAQSIGTFAIHNPDQPSVPDNSALTNMQETVQAVERCLGVSLTLKDHLGLMCGESGVPWSYLQNCGAAVALRRRFENAPKRVLEIGAGAGYFGTICWQWNVKEYTVVDLASMAIASAYNIASWCGEDRMYFCGGEPNRNAFARFYHANDYLLAMDHPQDLVFNLDSFPEIPNHIQDAYLKGMEYCLSDGGVFVSFNQESNVGGQRRVSEAIATNGHYRQISRHDHHIRSGYVEEAFVLK